LGRRSDEYFDPRRSRVEQLDGPQGRPGKRGLEAEAGGRRANRRLRQPSARAHTDGARPGRRAAADGLPVRARGWRAPLRRDQRQEVHSPPQYPEPSGTGWSTSPTRSSETPDNRTAIDRNASRRNASALMSDSRTSGRHAGQSWRPQAR
jgi:hypothetical protein